jgi:hypothetical protein
MLRPRLSRQREMPPSILAVFGGTPSFWVGEGAERSGPLHVAFVAPSRAAVNVFYHAAIEAGGADNGAPGASGGIRTHNQLP